MALPIKLVKPTTAGGRTVLSSLKNRRTVREIDDKKLSPQMLSNLLWAAGGVNRKKGPFGIPGITSATASNSQEIEIYVLLANGAYFYDPIRHILEPATEGDLRSLAIGPGQPGYAVKAPVHLIYTVNIRKLTHTAGYDEPGLRDPEVQKSYYYADCGLAAGNVYLFAASFGLATWFHNCNRPALAKKLDLSADHRVLFGQTVGYPKRTKKG